MLKLLKMHREGKVKSELSRDSIADENESTLVKPAKKERSVAATEEEKITKKMLATLQQMKDRHMRDQMRKQKEHAGLFG